MIKYIKDGAVKHQDNRDNEKALLAVGWKEDKPTPTPKPKNNNTKKKV